MGWPTRALSFAVIATLGTAGYFSIWRYHLKRFDTVVPGVLYRSAQPTEWGMRHLVRNCGVKTVISVRRDDTRLKTWIDTDEPDGPYESDCVQNLGARYLHWKLGGEAYWPWLSPKVYEEYFAIFDDPQSLPVAIHCVGGRHRTGTLAALYRLEYDRWSVTDTLAEMYSYDFGGPVQVHEHNLRTYYPRPRPSADQWQKLQAAFAKPGVATDFEHLVRRMRLGTHAEDLSILERLLEQQQPFAICLAERVIDSAGHPLASAAAAHALNSLGLSDQPPHEWASAAAILADWGSVEQQQMLLAVLQSEPREGLPSVRYQAVVRGVTNRYSPNRVPYLVPLLDDQRNRPEADAANYCYADTAVARLTSIVNELFVDEIAPLRDSWNRAAVAAKAWLQAHPEVCRPRKFDPGLFERFHQDQDDVEDKDDYRS